MKIHQPTEEQTLVLLKLSQALRRLGPIRSRIAKCGNIIEARMVHVNSELVEIMCAHLRPQLKQATIKHLSGNVLPVFVVQGENIIARISQLVGTEVNPEHCSEDSIRFKMWSEFGCQVEHITGHLLYYNNFIHCTRTVEEARRQIKAFIDPNLISFRF